MQDSSDRSLVARCINGDKAAWDNFVERFSQLIFRVIKGKLKRASYSYNQQDLEDIFQNVFVLLWEKSKLQQIRNRENISGWLAMVAANCTRNYFRAKREAFYRKDFSPAEEIAYSDCTAVKSAEQESLHNILKEVFSFLSSRECIILKLNYLYDKTHQEIARILKMPASTVSSVIKRTKEKIKEKLDKQGWEDAK